MSESSQFTVEPNNTWFRAVRQILALVILSAVAAVVLWRERYRGRALAGLIIAAIALALVNLTL